jgi:hypothetical protein
LQRLEELWLAALVQTRGLQNRYKQRISNSRNGIKSILCLFFTFQGGGCYGWIAKGLLLMPSCPVRRRPCLPVYQSWLESLR